jgi:hypothetical protein
MLGGSGVVNVIRPLGLSGSFSIASGDGLPDTLLMETVEDHTTQDRALVRRAAVDFF